MAKNQKMSLEERVSKLEGKVNVLLFLAIGQVPINVSILVAVIASIR